eukprot:TRINITY_DN105428_c1_g1_i1.p1 TRINITY_DN105428_c1_g1~~TRINITY_DN105428_c1_g1_i1.p1  ORF type:complete len:673 (+),score=30.50 TRINITY_DN105428_c1_g1_i1:1402-3420(+)
MKIIVLLIFICSFICAAPEYRSPIELVLTKCSSFAAAIEQSVPLDSCAQKVATAALKMFLGSTSINPLYYSHTQVNYLGEYISEGETADDSYNLAVTAKLGNIATVQFSMLLPPFCPLQTIDPAKVFIARVLSEKFDISLKGRDVLFTDLGVTNDRLLCPRPGLFIFLGVSLGIILLYIIGTTYGYFAQSKDKLFDKFIGCFRLTEVIKAIMVPESRGEAELNALNGIRVTVACWVILGHGFFLPIFEPFYNSKDFLDDTFNRYFMAAIKGGTLAVDVFLFLSGFLAALVSYKCFMLPENRSFKGFLKIYLHRYVRLTPMFALTIVCTIYIQPIMYKSGLHNSVQGQIVACENQWLSSLLYINNFFTEVGDYCNGWVWYLYVDMQLFFVTPLLVLAYYWCRAWTMGFITLGCAVSLGYQMWLAFTHNLNLTIVKFSYSFAGLPSEGDQRTIYYAKPYCRLIPYFMGVILLLLYQESKLGVENGFIRFVQRMFKGCSCMKHVIAVVGFGLMFCSVGSFYFVDRYQEHLTDFLGALHMVFCRVVFTFGLCMFLYPLLTGRLTWLSKVLGNSITGPLGRLAYGMYMLHIPIYAVVTVIMGKNDYYTVPSIVTKVSVTIAMSYVVSFVATVLYEAPLVRITKLLLEKKEAKQEKLVVESGEMKALLKGKDKHIKSK